MNTHSGTFDKIHRDGINQEARMMFAKGIKDELHTRIACAHWESCPPLKKVPDNTPNLSGIKIGRMTVMGLAKDMKSRWVVRCACGDYEVRLAKSIKNPENHGDRCVKCRRVAQVRRHHAYFGIGEELDPRLI
jgi:hypothetical protein